MKETELAKQVISWLQDLHWDVYQEVCRGYGYPVADIVAIQGNISWIIETKMSLSLALIDQAWWHQYYANYVSVATPSLKKAKGRRVAKILLDHLGIGHLSVEEGGSIYEFSKPKLNRRTIRNISLFVNEHHKTFAEAGNNLGKYWSPFKQTVNNLYAYLKDHPGSTIKEVMENIEHHYHSTITARSTILQWIHKGIINNLRIERDGRIIKLYYEEK